MALLANLFVPFGIAGAHTGPLGLPVAVLLVAAKVVVLAVAIAAGEVFVAKLRLFRVPELLAGSLVLGLLAVLTSSFLAASA